MPLEIVVRTPSPAGLPLACVAAAALIVSCGDGGSEDAGPPPEPTTTTWDVEYKPGVVELDAAAVTEPPVWLASAGRWEIRLEPGAAVEEGTIFVAPGHGIFTALSVEDDGDGLFVRGERTELTDAIENGRVAWDLGINSNDWPEFGSITQELQSDELEFKGELGSWEVGYKLTPAAPDIRGTLDVKWKPSGVELAASASTKIGPMRSSGEFVIAGGAYTQREMRFDDIEFEVELNSGGAKGAATGDAKLGIPLKTTIPMSLGPIPAFAVIGATIELSVSMGASSAILAKAKYRFRGDVTITHGAPAGWTVDVNIEESSFTPGGFENTTTDGAAIGVLVKLPQFELGLGVPGTDASLLLDFEWEIVNKAIPAYEEGLIVGNCSKQTYGMQSKVGGRIRVLGFSIGQANKRVFGTVDEQIKEVRPGDCDGV